MCAVQGDLGLFGMMTPMVRYVVCVCMVWPFFGVLCDECGNEDDDCANDAAWSVHSSIVLLSPFLVTIVSRNDG